MQAAPSQRRVPRQDATREAGQLRLPLRPALREVVLLPRSLLPVLQRGARAPLLRAGPPRLPRRVAGPRRSRARRRCRTPAGRRRRGPVHPADAGRAGGHGRRRAERRQRRGGGGRGPAGGAGGGGRLRRRRGLMSTEQTPPPGAPPSPSPGGDRGAGGTLRRPPRRRRRAQHRGAPCPLSGHAFIKVVIKVALMNACQSLLPCVCYRCGRTIHPTTALAHARCDP